MWPVTHDLGLRSLYADALFVSGLRRCDAPGAAQVRQAIAAAIRAFGRSGCAGRVAQEFGDHHSGNWKPVCSVTCRPTSAPGRSPTSPATLRFTPSPRRLEIPV
jgi:hypothetical protein